MGSAVRRSRFRLIARHSTPVLQRSPQFSRLLVTIPGGVSMRTRMFAVVGLVTILGVATAQVEFKPYASTDGRYKALFPGPVKTEAVDVPSGKAEVKVTIDSVELRGGTAFMVTY